jgi:hypothetical protein
MMNSLLRNHVGGKWVETGFFVQPTIWTGLSDNARTCREEMVYRSLPRAKHDRSWHPQRGLCALPVSPFRQKFLEIDRRQGGDVAPPSSGSSPSRYRNAHSGPWIRLGYRSLFVHCCGIRWRGRHTRLLAENARA